MNKNEIAFLVLAAGKSSRTPIPKSLFKIGSTSWIQHQIESIKTAGFTKVFSVLGYHRELIEPEINVPICINADPDRGQFSSIQVGIEKILHETTCSRIAILPIDVPFVGEAGIEILCNSMAEIAIPTFQNRGGHPLLISSEFARKLLELPASSRLDQLIQTYESVERVPLENEIITKNLNTEELFNAYLESVSFDLK